MYMYIMYIPGRALSLNVVSDNKGSRYINIKDRQASETKQGRSSWMQFVEKILPCISSLNPNQL
jgi:hypothetical protein